MLCQFAPGYRVVDQLASVKLTEAARAVEKVLPLNADKENTYGTPGRRR